MKLKLSEAVSAFTELPLAEQPLIEANFAVDVGSLGLLIVVGSSEGEVKSRVGKMLKGGKESIKSVRKITKDKAGKASKALGEELPSDSLEAAFNQANRGSTGADSDGTGETDPGDHQRGKAKPGQRWLKANPKNQW